MLGLPYPGGPMIEKLALSGDPKKFEFPLPFKESGELKFSFSGLKTSLRYRLNAMKTEEIEKEKANLAASFQYAVVEALVLMVRRALKKNSGYRSMGLCGGVAQNNLLRARLQALSEEFGVELLTAQPKHCGDNTAMIAFAAWADLQGTMLVKSFEPTLGLTG